MSIATTSRGGAAHWNGLKPLGLTSCSGNRCAVVWSNIRAYHMRNGWNDVAYNHGICPGCGRLYVGRGWGVRSAANGTTAANTEWHAWMVMVGGSEPFTDVSKVRLRELNAEHHRRYGSSRLTTHHAVRGGTTACPGLVIRKWVADGAPLPTKPKPEPKPAPAPEDDMARSMLTRIDGSTAVYQIVGQLLVAVTSPSQAALIVQHAGLEDGTARTIEEERRWQKHVGNMTVGEAKHFTVVRSLDELGSGGMSQSQADTRYAAKGHGHTVRLD